MASEFDKYPKAVSKGSEWDKYPRLSPNLASGNSDPNSFISRVRTGAGGLIEGIPVLGPAIRGATDRLAAATIAGMSDETYDQVLDRIQAGTAEEKAANPGLDMTAQVGGNVLGSLMIPGSTMASLPRAAATSALTEAADTTTRSLADTGELPSAPQVLTGALIGAVLGSGGYGLGKMFQRPALDPVTNDAVDLLTREGVDITQGQATRNPALLKREASSSGAYDFAQKQMAKYSQAVLRKVGIDAPDGQLLPHDLVNSLDAVGQTMDGLAARNVIPPNTRGTPILGDMTNEVNNAVNHYKSLISGRPAAIVRNMQTKLNGYLKTGIPGDEYASLRSELQRAAGGTSSPELETVLRSMRNSLDEAMDKSIAAFNPADSDLWRMARRQYGNLLVMQEASARTASSGGVVTPAILDAAQKAMKGKKLVARGYTDFDELARAGQSLLRPLPIGNNGSAGELIKAAMKTFTGSSVAGMAGYTMGGPGMGIAMGAIPAVAGKVGDIAAMLPMRLRPLASGATGAKIATGAATAINERNPFKNLRRREE